MSVQGLGLDSQLSIWKVVPLGMARLHHHSIWGLRDSRRSYSFQGGHTRRALLSINSLHWFWLQSTLMITHILP